MCSHPLRSINNLVPCFVYFDCGNPLPDFGLIQYLMCASVHPIREPHELSALGFQWWWWLHAFPGNNN